MNFFSGVVLNAAKRIQVNLNLVCSDLYQDLRNVRDVTMLPIYWAEQSGQVTPDEANQFKSTVYAIKYGISGGVWGLVGLAGETKRHPVIVRCYDLTHMYRSHLCCISNVSCWSCGTELS